MGGGKPLRILGGRTLLTRAVERARCWSDCVSIAARTADQVGDCGAPVLIDERTIQGPLGGLASARRLGRKFVLTIPCDMPFLPADLPVRLAAALADRGAALASSGGHVHPVCALWRTEALAELESYAATGRRSLRGLAEMVGYEAVEWEGAAFFNINDEQELAEAERGLG